MQDLKKIFKLVKFKKDELFQFIQYIIDNQFYALLTHMLKDNDKFSWGLHGFDDYIKKFVDQPSLKPSAEAVSNFFKLIKPMSVDANLSFVKIYFSEIDFMGLVLQSSEYTQYVQEFKGIINFSKVELYFC